MKKIKTSQLPQKPGVYFFKNKNSRIIYIGKALNLKKRVQSYFYQKKQDDKTQKMLANAVGLGHQTTSSEFEALLLEAKLIKEHQPKFNIQLKDGKRYLYIAMTKAPYRIFPTRRPELENDLLDWFGPFPSGTAVREVLKILRRPFPFCSCVSKPKRQCLYSHINLCPGYHNLESEKYREDIERIRHILSGRTKTLSRELKKKMNIAAKALRFEEAQKFKNQLLFLEHITQGWRPIAGSNENKLKALFKLKKLITKYQGISLATINKIEGYDVSNLGEKVIVGAMVVFIEGEAEKGLYRKFKINNPKLSPHLTGDTDATRQNDPAGIFQIVLRRLNHPEWLYPQLILIDGGKPQTSSAFQALQKKGLQDQIAVIGLAKKEEEIIIPRINRNRITGYHTLRYSARSPVRQLMQSVRDEAHRFAQKYYRHLHLRQFSS